MSDETNDGGAGNGAELSDIRWDLSHLLDHEVVPEGSDPKQAVIALLDKAEELIGEFAAAYRGKVGELDGPGLIEAMRSQAELSDIASRAANYAHLWFSTDTSDPQRGALLQLVRERSTALMTEGMFFELEWVEVPDERAAELLSTDGLDFARHHLETERLYRPHMLSEPEEKIVTELSVSGRSAWSRLFDELTSAIRVDVAGADEPQPLDVALAGLQNPDRDARKALAESVTEALEPGLRTRAYVFNTLLQDKSTSDRLRGFDSWVASRNLSNEVSDEAVQALVDAVQNRYELARRWYRTKAKLLGIERLADYDRMAAVTEDDVSIPFSEGRELVLDVFGSFSDEAGEVVQRFFDERWIDAPPGDGKRGGAFSASAVPSVHPYVMLNYTDKRRDVLTLAHELGHGLHQALGREQGIFHQSTPLTVAETASVFAEELTFGRLLAAAEDPASRLSLLAESVEGQIATVFRQIAMNRFEHAVHTARRGEGELAVERINELWAESQHDLLGDSVEVTDGYHSWWSYVPHFIGSPGYVYAYAFGQLLALSVYSLYEEQGDEIVPGYMAMLTAGGSKPPEELAAMVGVDLTDPGFWESGLDLVEKRIDAAEEAAEAALATRS